MVETVENYLSFRVGTEWYGVDIGYITEVLHMVGLTELPGTGDDVLGLLTLRDTVMPVVDLRILFQLPDTQLQLNTPIIAMQIPQGPLALVVDDVDDVEEIADIMDYQGEETPYVRGVVRRDDRLLLLLDVEEVYAESRIEGLHAAAEATEVDEEQSATEDEATDEEESVPEPEVADEEESAAEDEAMDEEEGIPEPEAED